MPSSILLDEQLLRVALVAVVLSSFGIYGATNVRHEDAAVITGWFDDRIPFLPVFSLPYLLYLPYLFFIIAYGILLSPYWANIAASALAIQLVAAYVYKMHQTHVPRPKVTGKDVFSRLTAFIYRHDEPYNCFPSLHVAYSLLCLYWSAYLFPAAFPAFAVFTAAIILSTLFIKQHAVADVISGASITVLTLLIIGI